MGFSPKCVAMQYLYHSTFLMTPIFVLRVKGLSKPPITAICGGRLRKCPIEVTKGGKRHFYQFFLSFLLSFKNDPYLFKHTDQIGTLHPYPIRYFI